MRFEISRISLFLVFEIIYITLCEEWVNPMDMSRKNVKFVHVKNEHVGNVQDSHHLSLCQGDLEKCENENKSCVYFMTRFVNILLRNTGVQDLKYPAERMKSFGLEGRISGSDLEKLQGFGDGKTLNLVDLDDIFSRVFDERSDDRENIYVPDEISDSNRETSYIIETTLILITISSLILCGRPYKTILFLFVTIVFMLNFGVTSIRMYYDEVAEREAYLTKTSGLPIECKPSEMTWFQKTVNYFSSRDECEEYYRRLADPRFRVRPAKVFAETISTMFLGPLDELGSALGRNVAGFSDLLPWPLNVAHKTFSALLMTFFIPICVVLTIIFSLGVRMKLGWLLGSFEISTQRLEPPNGTRRTNQIRNHDCFVKKTWKKSQPVVMMNSKAMMTLIQKNDAQKRRSFKVMRFPKPIRQRYRNPLDDLLIE